jgi:hypothetical protein
LQNAIDAACAAINLWISRAARHENHGLSLGRRQSVQAGHFAEIDFTPINAAGYAMNLPWPSALN